MPAGSREPQAEGDLATSTLAEIYAQQGLYERALAIYERIAQRTPHDASIAERIEALTRRLERAGAAVPPDGGGMNAAPMEEPRSSVRAVIAEEAAGRETESTPVAKPRDDEFLAWLNSR